MARPNYRLAGAALLLVLGALGCTTQKTTTPPLTGPSDVGTSLQIQVIPDTIVQDGASQSLVTVTAFGPNGQPLRSVPLRAEIVVAGAITDFGSLSARNIVTDANGRATVTYTAPPPPPVFVDGGTIVSISMTASGSDFGNATPRVATIRLVPPGVIGPPPSPFRPDFAVPTATVGDSAVFSASVVDSGGFDVTNQVATYAWSFGDGDTASGRTVSHVYDDPGSFSVTLAITDGLGRRATVSKSVSVNPAVTTTPAIVFSPSSPTVGQTVNFSGATSRPPAGHSITSYSWDFGDGTGGSGVTTSHAYAAQGNYNVILAVTFSNGGQATGQTQVSVGTLSSPSASFTFAPSSPFAAQNVVFNASASTAPAGRTITSYAWTFGDGAQGSGVQTNHSFNAPGSYIVQLTVTDNTGQTGVTTQTVTVVSGNPTSSFIFSPTNPATNQSVVFDGSGSTALGGRTITGYTWTFGDGSPSQTGQTTNHTYTTSGTFVVRLTVTDSAGQTGASTQSITVTSDPAPSFTFSPVNPTAGANVFFDSSASAVGPGRSIQSYAWNFGDPTSGASNISSSSSPNHAFATAGSYTVTLTITDSAGRTNSTTRTVTVTP
jgi:PKD repeat protein